MSQNVKMFSLKNPNHILMSKKRCKTETDLEKLKLDFSHKMYLFVCCNCLNAIECCSTQPSSNM